MRLVTKVERTLGDLVNEAPFLSVEQCGINEVSVYPQGWDPNRAPLMADALRKLRKAGLPVQVKRQYDSIMEVIVTGKAVKL